MGTILRLRGLPFSATEEDIRAFFEPCDCGELPAVYLGAKNGKRDGSAYVQFATTEDAAKALKERQHEHMGNRYIEIFAAAEADLVAQTSVVGGEGGQPSLLGPVVRLRGLPFSSTGQEVLDFFSGVETLGGEAGVVFTCTPDGRPTGEAYVALADADALAAALARHKEKIGARYIEIFESSRGDMFQAVQQHGFFTTTAGRRRHHWHQQHGGGAAAAAMAAGAGYPPDAGVGGRSGQMDDLAAQFAGFGLSQRDMQVPGPPRWGAYGAPADQQYQQYVGGPPHQMQQRGMLPAGGMRWRPNQMQPGMQHFNPAPGPPPGKGGRGSMANGTRQSGGSMSAQEYAAAAAAGHSGAVMFGPFMMQHPLMMQAQPQHHSTWGAPGMMQQQGGTWYGGMQMGRSMHSGLHASMAGHHYSFPPSYFPMQQQQQRGAGMSPHGGGSGYHHHQQHGGSRAQPHAASSGGAAHASAAVPPPPPGSPPMERTGSSKLPEAEEEGTAAAADRPDSTSDATADPGSAAAAAEAPAASAPPATPEQ